MWILHLKVILRYLLYILAHFIEENVVNHVPMLMKKFKKIAQSEVVERPGARFYT